MSVINSSRYYFTDNISDLLSEISSVSELQYLALILDESHDNKLIAELPLLLTTESFNNLINYYGGETIRIPTKDEIYNNLVGLMSYYYNDIRKVNWNDVFKILGMPRTSGNKRLLSNRYHQVADRLKDIKIPEISVSKNIEDNHNRYRDDKVKKVIRLDSRVVSEDEYKESVNTFLSSISNDKIIDEDTISKLKEYLNE